MDAVRSNQEIIKHRIRISYVFLPILLCLSFGSAHAASVKNSTKQNVSKTNSSPKVNLKQDPESQQPPNLPSVNVLSNELGFSLAEFEKNVEDFASALAQGLHSKPYQKICVKNEVSCHLLSDFFAQADGQKKEHWFNRKKMRLAFGDMRAVLDAQRYDFQYLIQGVHSSNENQYTELADLALKSVDCPRNLSAALSILGEEFFPSTIARNYTKQLFNHAKQCLGKNETAYERLHLRQGLYAYYEGEKTKAHDFLIAASNSLKPQERYRSLYWLGRIDYENGVSAEKNEYWQALINQYSLSYYAIDASVLMKKDPMTVITNQRVGGFKRALPGNEILNTQIRWLEALYIYKKQNAVAKWASWIVRSTDSLDVDVLHYLSALKISSGLYRSNITMMFSYFKKHPTELNAEGLKLLYPRPFFQMVKDASKNKIDTFFVLGLMRQESAFDPNAVSRANARGLMQIEPNTARRLASVGARRLFNEKENTTMGIKYLIKLADQFNGKMELVLAGYNAGPMKVEAWLRRNPLRPDPLLWNDLIPYMETRDYVVSILRNNYFYARLYGKKDGYYAETRGYSSELVNKLLSAKVQ